MENTIIHFSQVPLPDDKSETRMRIVYDFAKEDGTTYFLFEDDQVATTPELAKELEGVLNKIFGK